jgi:hypothetical protein
LITFVYSYHLFKKLRVNGLKGIVISDRDGVPLFKLSKDNKLPELGTKSSFISTFSIATVQSSKMLLGKNKSIVSFFKSTTVKCFFHFIIDKRLNLF